MNKPLSKDWPGLADFVNSQGMEYQFADFFDHKYRADGCYVVLAWRRDPNGDRDRIGFCDIARSSFRGPWQFQNDSEECTIEQWKKLRVDPYCDGFTLPEENDE